MARWKGAARDHGRLAGGVAAGAVACALALALPSPAVALQAGATGPAGVVSELSLREAVDLAHRHNPEYGIQASGLETLGWERRETWANFLPSLNASNSFGYTASGERRFGDVSLATQPARYSSSYNIGLSLSLNGSTFLQPGIQRAQHEAVRADVRGASAALTDQVTQVYLAVLRAGETLAQAEAELERTATYVREAEARVEVGAGTPLDIRRAEVQQGQAEVQLLQARNTVATTRLALGRVLGASLSDDLVLTTRFEVFDPGLDLESLLALGSERNPDLAAARSRQTAARSQVRAARTQYLPTVSLSAGVSGSVFQTGNTDLLVDDRLGQLASQYQNCLEDNRLRELLGDPPRDCSQLNPEIPAVADQARRQVELQNQGYPFGYQRNPLSLSMNISLPVFNGFSRELQVEQTRVADHNALRQVRGAELTLRADIEAGVRAVETARQVITLQGRIRETAAEELRLAQERFRLGLASSIEVVEAQAGLSQAERDEINAIYDFHLSFAALEALVGMPLRES
jgi:outer membrane protein